MPLIISFILLVSLMSAASFAIYADSRGHDGELFPSLRIVQKNGGIYKQMVASDVGNDALSPKFTKQLGVYSSWGNLLSLAYPDLWKAYFQEYNAPKANDFISEAFQYIGIMPFIIALIGLIYSKSRWRILALVMLVVISINMISWEGVHNRPPNILQEAFNTIFPFLKMIEVREVFSGFFLLWLCLLLSLGLRIFFDSVNFRAFVDMKLRALLMLPAMLVAGKVIVSYVYLRPSLYLSPVDVTAFIVIGVFAVLIYLYKKNILTHARLCAVALAITLVDIGYYNLSMKPYVLVPNTLAPALEAKLNKDAGFAYFRIPFVLANLAFIEPMLKVKGAMSRGNNHHLFTTKRYYDYFTHLPLEKQFVLSGVDTPIIRFFSKTDARIFKDRSDVLTYMSNANEEELRNNLSIEQAVDNGAQGGRKGNGLVLTSLDQFPDLPDLNPQNIVTAYKKHMAASVLGEAGNPEKQMTTDLSTIVVKDFSPNGVTVDVNNAQDGYLYYNDGYSKYWDAYDNGKETPINIANYNFKAVFLPRGEHRVVFVYNPWRYKVGLLAYATGLFISVILAAFFFFKSRAKTEQKSR
ncbi:MAG: YfhO family protein [Deltaproteobacteria bacterium]|nr:YfhO family protein [Deltaproteobacteria bacterium]